MKTWIKFCGTTNLEDARASYEAGADAIGFIFAPSKRQISVETAAAVARELPGLLKTGVFVDESAERVLEAAHTVGLTSVQLHGEETPEYVKELVRKAGDTPLRTIKVITADEGRFRNLGNFDGGEHLVDSIMLDSGSSQERGGTGRAFDWLYSMDFILSLEQRVNVVIAGGLAPDNVGAAISLFRPWGVDVVSGVESEPGRKDHTNLRAFVAAVRAAERKISQIS